jgi:hypothetical protein
MFLTLCVGIATILLSVIVYGIATTSMIQVVVPLLQRERARASIVKNMGVMMFIALATAFVHLLQIAVWALVLQNCAGLQSFDDAFYCSAQNYTALGYGDVLLPAPWRLLGPLEAVNGLLLFGLSTALMFAIMGRLIAYRLPIIRELDRNPLYGTSWTADALPVTKTTAETTLLTENRP